MIRRHTRHTFGGILLLCLIAAACVTPTPGLAQSQKNSTAKAKATPPAPPSAAARLRAKNRELDAARGKTEALQKRAETLEQDIQRIREGLVAAARIIQHHETRTGELESQLADLNAKQDGIRKLFKARRIQLGKVLAALQRMARNPPEALIGQPIPPADMVRSAILLRAVLPRLEGEARELAGNLADLMAARDEAETRRAELDGELGKLEEQRQVLKRLLGRKSRLRRRTVRQTTQASRQAAKLSTQAASLQDLVGRLNQLRAKREAADKAQVAQARRAPQASKAASSRASQTQGVRSSALRRPGAMPKGFSAKPFDAAKGNLPFPVVGRVVARYGQAIANGRIHKGLTIETTVRAQVIAPYEGKIVFSGPFRGYGQLLIIEHTGGYHTLLAGMARIDAAVGQWFLVGEPVGIMGRAKQVSANGRSRVQRPALYVEFRRKGQPIDPLAWLATRKSKVSG
ncbi:MAG: peptidoglycan DD-metalloendopeptidase family protein [Rhodospirillaceae bacterium]|jgi:murein hydrolase activator|nr:peptidoglycan DD-metalloendopeptidase family protein [Rhodospirillaceae bacterium]